MSFYPQKEKNNVENKNNMNLFKNDEERKTNKSLDSL